MTSPLNRRDVAHDHYQLKPPMGTYGVLPDYSPVIARAYDLTRSMISATPFELNKIRFVRASMDKVRDGVIISGAVTFDVAASDSEGKNRRASVEIKIISGVPVPTHRFSDELGNEFQLDRRGVSEFLGIGRFATAEPRDRDVAMFACPVASHRQATIFGSQNLTSNLVKEIPLTQKTKKNTKWSIPSSGRAGYDDGMDGAPQTISGVPGAGMDPANGQSLTASGNCSCGMPLQEQAMPDGSKQFVCPNCSNKKATGNDPSKVGTVPGYSSTSGAPLAPIASLAHRRNIVASLAARSELLAQSLRLNASTMSYNDFVEACEQSVSPVVRCGKCDGSARVYASDNCSLLIECKCGFKRFYSADDVDAAQSELPSYGVSEAAWHKIENEYTRNAALGRRADDEDFVRNVAAIVSDDIFANAAEAGIVAEADGDKRTESKDVYLSPQHRVNLHCRKCRLFIPMGDEGSGVPPRDTCGQWKTPIGNVRVLGKPITHCVPTSVLVTMQGESNRLASLTVGGRTYAIRTASLPVHTTIGFAKQSAFLIEAVDGSAETPSIDEVSRKGAGNLQDQTGRDRPSGCADELGKDAVIPEVPKLANPEDPAIGRSRDQISEDEHVLYEELLKDIPTGTYDMPNIEEGTFGVSPSTTPSISVSEENGAIVIKIAQKAISASAKTDLPLLLHAADFIYNAENDLSAGAVSRFNSLLRPRVAALKMVGNGIYAVADGIDSKWHVVPGSIVDVIKGWKERES